MSMSRDANDANELGGGESRELGWSTKLAVEMGGEKRLQNIRKIN